MKEKKEKEKKKQKKKKKEKEKEEKKRKKKKGVKNCPWGIFWVLLGNRRRSLKMNFFDFFFFLFLFLASLFGGCGKEGSSK